MAYSEIKYDKYRNWIKEKRRKGVTWDLIFSGLQPHNGRIDTFLSDMNRYNGWTIKEEEWMDIVQLEKDNEEKSRNFDAFNDGAIITLDKGAELPLSPTDDGTAWNNYVLKLKKNGFPDASIEGIRESVLRMLGQMKRETLKDDPVRGLVIGNVQSGKTANMAGLISMAADYGWNMFIILSGTIENLRKQTQKRLLRDLINPIGNLSFHGLNDLSTRCPETEKTQNLQLSSGSKYRYLYVCLKNATRLRNLLGWINKDQMKKSEMKILVIDDESDQAGINTASITEAERKTINKLIINLVHADDVKGKARDKSYASMSYVGYTATPYANLLNEAGRESLYPKNFVSTLKVANTYFGPQQIFGADGTHYDGMSIINEIDEQDISLIRDIHQNVSKGLPQSLKEAIAWFLASSASLRMKDLKKPVSMLVHTSHKQDHHDRLKEAITYWFTNESKDTIYDYCESVWNKQTVMFNKEKLFEQYPDYGVNERSVGDFPEFGEFANELNHIISEEMTHIMLDDDNDMVFSTGVHLCIDNCKMNSSVGDEYHVRLAYPEEENMPNPAPIYIIIGGSTLSRGLTIEGLVSTYFLRSSTQADTLMQMGRWFGYRKGYELYPRIWLSGNTRKQFEFLSVLDDDLRREIHMMETVGASPAEYAPRILNSPKMSLIKITAKNRMQNATFASVDYSGTTGQTITFDNDYDKLCSNLKITGELVENLGNPQKDFSNPYSEGNRTWTNIDHVVVTNYLKQLVFPRQDQVYINIEMFAEWIDHMIENDKLGRWNITLSGLKNGPEVQVGPYVVHAANRAKKATSDDDLIKIGVLRRPTDLLADINMGAPTVRMKELMAEKDLKKTRLIRQEAGLQSTPHMIIYVVDKDSKPTRGGKGQARVNLDAPCHLIGICLDIPAGENGITYDQRIMIKLEDVMDREDIQ